MNENEYINIVKGIINTANNSDPAYILNNGKYSISDFYTLINSDDFKKAGYNAVLNADGSVRTYTYTNTNGQIDNSGSNVDGGLNSNTQTGTASGTVEFTQPMDTTMTTATETEQSVVQSAGKMTKFTNGVKGVGNFVFGSVIPAINAASTGIALGKTIDSILYNANPNFWDEHGMESLNPDTWKSITAGDDSLGAKAFNTIFGINPDTGDTQMYLDENAFAYMAMYLQSIGAFSEGKSIGKEQTVNNINIPEGIERLESITKPFRDNFPHTFLGDPFAIDGDYYLKPKTDISTTIRYTLIKSTNSVHLIISAIGELSYVEDWGYMFVKVSDPTYPRGGSTTRQQHITIDNKTITYIDLEMNNYESYIFNIKVPVIDNYTNNFGSAVAWYLWYGNWSTESAIDGITDQDNAITPDLSNANTIDEVLDALKEQYPDLWNNRVENTVVQPDGTTKTYTYIPVPMPTGGVGDKPTTPGASQDKPSIDPSDATDTLRKTIIKILTQPKPVGMVDTAVDPVNPNPPDTGSGKTPILTPPTGASNALYSIYNPTQSQLNSFGAWLWSSNFVDQILKVFSDPMQAIIGLHKVFAKPSISGTGNIKVGYLDSGVSSNIVGGQYTTVDCGLVNLYEYYGNVFDYDPYTKINLYLPFIGIVPLNTGEVMRSSIHVVYHIDVLTGACLAEVKIIRDMAGGTLYQYSGNAAVQYPISSGSYMGIVSGILSIAGGIAGTIATGGAAMPVLLGAGASVGRMHTDISHSGSFSGNAGAMGIKKPYLIIDRPQSSLAKNFQNYVGYPSNSTVTLSGCKGFTKVKEIHLENIPATNNELTDIETKLKSGVII